MLDICLIVAGVIVIVVSFVISDKADQKKNMSENAGQVTEIWTSKDEQNVRDHIEKILDEKAEESIGHVDDELDRLSNEKIMAVSEYSDQVLEKISQNHKEVVFLYDMLNQKNQEMKTMIKTIDTTKTQAEEAAIKVEEGVKKLKELLKTQSAAGSNSQKQQKDGSDQPTALSMNGQNPLLGSSMDPTSASQAAVLRKRAENRGLGGDKLVSPPAANMVKQESTGEKTDPGSEPSLRPVSAMTALERFALNKMIAEGKAVDPSLASDHAPAEGADNKNEQILKLYEEGKSILEIAKSLGLGQGEVKLVVNLFKNSKK